MQGVVVYIYLIEEHLIHQTIQNKQISLEIKAYKNDMKPIQI